MSSWFPSQLTPAPATITTMQLNILNPGSVSTVSGFISTRASSRLTCWSRGKRWVSINRRSGHTSTNWSWRWRTGWVELSWRSQNWLGTVQKYFRHLWRQLFFFIFIFSLIMEWKWIKINIFEWSLSEAGLEYEVHEFTTEDGYIIQLHRIPARPGECSIVLTGLKQRSQGPFLGQSITDSASM